MNKEVTSLSCRRCASHAGSWYTDDPKHLKGQLSKWLATAVESLGAAKNVVPVKAIIAPHAGYSYSGPTAAWAYGAIQNKNVKRIFVLGPSHHYYLQGCALSDCASYDTPLGSLQVDQNINAALRKEGTYTSFNTMSKSQDEEEHSIEMHLPYIAKIMEGCNRYTIVPILVGTLSASDELKYAGILQKYFDNPENLFIISSDFCHWGHRFSFQFHDERFSQIYRSIEWLDHEGMTLIEKQDINGFRSYLKKYRNTICGRNPICLLLQMMVNSELKLEAKFTHYAQSSQCIRVSDSSVSYASCVISNVSSNP